MLKNIITGSRGPKIVTLGAHAMGGKLLEAGPIEESLGAQGQDEGDLLELLEVRQVFFACCLAQIG